MIPADILLLIPQRPPFVMIDKLLHCDETGIQTVFLVRDENVLVSGNELSEAGLMENIAQTAAAAEGYSTRKENRPVATGYIASVKNFEIFGLPKVNDELITEVKIENRVLEMTVISGIVRCNDIIMAQCEMNIFIGQIMREVFIVSDNIFSPIGSTSAENFKLLKEGVSGIREHQDTALADQPFYASLFNRENYFIGHTDHAYTKFEQLLIASVKDALQNSPVAAEDKRTVLIISSTKGNISLLETAGNDPDIEKKISLPASARLIAEYFGFVNQPIVISNACISGIVGILTGMRLIQSGQYDHAVIAGADVISKFILSGFQSFGAISSMACKPFDAGRDGITLGEGAATVILSACKNSLQDIKVMGGAVSNDANHISAPSRTGEELNEAIGKTLADAHIPARAIDFISAHGTATIYNDEMEAKAITLANLQTVPVNSLKGYYGHTLGAAGLIESIISIHSLKENLFIRTAGFMENGTTDPINITKEHLAGNFKNCLKTASGFGGCNAAILFSRQ
jgi:3-oxoacyl-[acyl-carrier-protein] synthase-1